MDPGKVKLLQNQPYDESVEVSDAEEVVSTNPTPRMSKPQSGIEEEEDGGVEYPRDGSVPQASGMMYEDEEEDEETNEEEESEEEQDNGGIQQTLTGGYDPNEYENLQVSPEIRELFKHISRYTPQNINLDCRLIPFVPEYIPAIGDIDAFIKVTRPDGAGDRLGLTVLDEPSTKQSDPHVLDLQLRTHAKQSLEKPAPVHNIKNPEAESKTLDSWIENIKELHRQKPATNVHYTRNMPDIETLMQEWPSDFVESLKEVGLPNAELDCNLEEFVDIMCGLLDIPVRGNRIHSLHVLFSLFMEFKNSQHFTNYIPPT
ncbi:PREDICTED: intraflagellar transport protein 46 homolog [Amphimedon queenslandica]|uniref:Intraflagellar transport protein 46 homolog n=1 Tax=Amphimedon queenslandica TaxID=400682 RepID=A0AAN0IFL9_AMPQE|nr:PREDICTED: intraflagellar transport protein 46 homolog [Amphimedon queenslandica]|eukprot:XP_003387568.1 PREDICTED: intraflagellar transport protein 46 homolog [Amphimedon queenslandica]